MVDSLLDLDTESGRRVEAANHATMIEALLDSMISATNADADVRKYAHNTQERVGKLLDDVKRDSVATPGRKAVNARFACGMDDDAYLNMACIPIYVGATDDSQNSFYSDLPPDVRLASAKAALAVMERTVRDHTNQSIQELLINKEGGCTAYISQLLDIPEVNGAVLRILSAQGGVDGRDQTKEPYSIPITKSARLSSWFGEATTSGAQIQKELLAITDTVQAAYALVDECGGLWQTAETVVDWHVGYVAAKQHVAQERLRRLVERGNNPQSGADAPRSAGTSTEESPCANDNQDLRKVFQDFATTSLKSMSTSLAYGTDVQNAVRSLVTPSTAADVRASPFAELKTPRELRNDFRTIVDLLQWLDGPFPAKDQPPERDASRHLNVIFNCTGELLYDEDQAFMSIALTRGVCSLPGPHTSGQTLKYNKPQGTASYRPPKGASASASPPPSYAERTEILLSKAGFDVVTAFKSITKRDLIGEAVRTVRTPNQQDTDRTFEVRAARVQWTPITQALKCVRNAASPAAAAADGQQQARAQLDKFLKQRLADIVACEPMPTKFPFEPDSEMDACVIGFNEDYKATLSAAKAAAKASVLECLLLAIRPTRASNASDMQGLDRFTSDKDSSMSLLLSGSLKLMQLQSLGLAARSRDKYALDDSSFENDYATGTYTVIGDAGFMVQFPVQPGLVTLNPPLPDTSEIVDTKTSFLSEPSGTPCRAGNLVRVGLMKTYNVDDEKRGEGQPTSVGSATYDNFRGWSVQTIRGALHDALVNLHKLKALRHESDVLVKAREKNNEKLKGDSIDKVEERSRERRQELWKECYRLAAASGDRMFAFARKVSGRLSEDVSEVLATGDDEMQRAQRDLMQYRKQLSERTIAFQTTMINSVLQAAVKSTNMQVAFQPGSGKEPMVMINKDVRDAIEKLSRPDEARPFFQTSVQLQEVLQSPNEPISLRVLTEHLMKTGQEYYLELAKAYSNQPGSRLSIETLSKPHNLLLMRFKPDFYAALGTAFTSFTTTMRQHYHHTRHINLWELVETDPSHMLMNETFAAYVALALQYTRNHSSSRVVYVAEHVHLAVGTAAKAVRNQLVDLACRYLQTHPHPPAFTTLHGREMYYGARVRDKGEGDDDARSATNTASPPKPPDSDSGVGGAADEQTARNDAVLDDVATDAVKLAATISSSTTSSPRVLIDSVAEEVGKSFAKAFNLSPPTEVAPPFVMIVDYAIAVLNRGGTFDPQTQNIIGGLFRLGVIRTVDGRFERGALTYAMNDLTGSDSSRARPPDADASADEQRAFAEIKAGVDRITTNDAVLQLPQPIIKDTKSSNLQSFAYLIRGFLYSVLLISFVAALIYRVEVLDYAGSMINFATTTLRGSSEDEIVTLDTTGRQPELEWGSVYDVLSNIYDNIPDICSRIPGTCSKISEFQQLQARAAEGARYFRPEPLRASSTSNDVTKRRVRPLGNASEPPAKVKREHGSTANAQSSTVMSLD